MTIKQEKVKRALAINHILKRLFPRAGIVLKYRTPWECLVAVQLSAQCTDKKVNEVTARLFRKYRKLDDYVKARPRVFYRNKTKNILAAAKLVSKKFGGKVPRSMGEMLSIPGVARKTANVVLGSAYGVVEGIAVDTHVIRLTRQWGLTRHHDPVCIERDLMALLPKREWYAWTYRVIEYGRSFSPARKKDHSDEPLARFYLQGIRKTPELALGGLSSTVSG
jgi:endonuclease-3